MARTALLLLATLTLLSTRCREKESPEIVSDDPALPPATTTGEGTFGMRVNGEPWIPYQPRFPDAEITYHSGLGLEISAGYWDDDGPVTKFTMMMLPTRVPRKVGPVLLDGRPDAWAAFGIFWPEERFEVIPGQPFLLNISHIDTVDRMTLSGTFHGRLLGDQSGDTLSITNGRFDLRY